MPLPPHQRGPFGNPKERPRPMKTGIHIERCNIGSAEAHNTREKEYLERLDASDKKTYDIFRDETVNNSSWVNPDYEGRTLPELFEQIKKEVKEKTGRALQDKATPIREGVCPVLPTTKAEDLQPVVDWYKKHGISVVRIDVHHDEGHTDAETNERKHNHHAHIIVDYMNHATGKSIKLHKDDICELQGVVADALGMERGEEKAKTKARHLGSAEYREKKAAANLARMQKQADEAEERAAAAEERALTAQHFEAEHLKTIEEAERISNEYKSLVEYGQKWKKTRRSIANHLLVFLHRLDIDIEKFEKGTKVPEMIGLTIWEAAKNGLEKFLKEESKPPQKKTIGPRR